MTLSTTTSRASFAGNGVTTVFSFPYYFLQEADLVVILRNDTTGVETVKTLTTHYTVSGEGVQAGGSVTMLTAPASGETLIIYRAPAIVQETDIRENDPFPAETNEMALDLNAMISQRLSDRVSRCVQLSEGYVDAFDPTLPNLIVPDTAIIVNPAGDGFVTGPTADDIENAQTYAGNAATSASAASASASAASASASAAAASASAAAASASSASTSASNAAASAASAAAAVSAHSALTTGVHGVTGTVVGTSDTQTLTNKTLNASNNTVSNLTASMMVGTGSSTGQVLTSTGSGSAPTWQAAGGGGSAAFTTKTTTATLTTSDDVVNLDMSGGGFTTTLPTASGNGGKKFYLRKSDSSTNIGTIDAFGAETINGAANTTVNTQDEVVVLVSDNVSNWEILERRTHSRIIAHTFPVTATSNPTKGGGTTVDNGSIWREGRFLCGNLEYRHTSAGSAGTGSYSWEWLNSGTWLADTTYVTPGPAVYTSHVGTGVIHNSTEQFGLSVEVNAANTGVQLRLDSENSLVSATRFSFGSGVIHIAFRFKIPIAGWND